MIENGQYILKIGSIIIVYPDGTKEWINVCTQHQQTVSDWLNYRKKHLPRESPSNQLGIQDFIPVKEEEKKFEEIPLEKRKQYLDGEYIGKYSG